jgi:hypothetical protein
LLPFCNLRLCFILQRVLVEHLDQLSNPRWRNPLDLGLLHSAALDRAAPELPNHSLQVCEMNRVYSPLYFVSV